MTLEKTGNPAIRWHVRLFEGPVLVSATGEESRRFRSQRVGALLAFLCLRLGSYCSREELCFALWPEEDDLTVASNRLRVTLHSLRTHLEPGGVPFNSVLDTSSPGLVRLRYEAVWCDVVEVERLLQRKQSSEARKLVVGSLLPGYYDDFVLQARERYGLELGTVPAGAEPGEPVTMTSTSIARSFGSPPPLYLTRYFGRDEELTLLKHHLTHDRLVTITGAGGVGKTRLAVEAVRGLSFPCVFVPLADVQHEDQISPSLLRSLGAVPANQLDTIEQLSNLIGQRGPVLLLLDNAEQVVSGVADLVFRVVTTIPSVRILVTSRQRLDIEGEILIPLEPLVSPGSDHSDEEFTGSHAVEMFVDRARLARPDFRLLPRHLEAMRKITSTLNGVPLAIELAAARISSQTPQQISDSLATNLLDIQSGRAGVPSRHRSLRASIQGSYDRLPAATQRLLRCMSIFRSGSTEEASRLVSGMSDAASRIAELIGASLLVARESDRGEQMRYSFLDTIRAFADEQLSSSEKTELEESHRRYFLGIAAQVTDDDVRTLSPLEDEVDNLRLAIEATLELEREDDAAGMIGALIFAHVRGHNRAFASCADRAIHLAPSVGNQRLRSRLRFSAYTIFSYLGLHQRSVEIGTTMVEEGRLSGDSYSTVLGLLVLSFAYTALDRLDEALGLAEESVAIARREQDTEIERRCYRTASYVYLTVGNARIDAGDSSGHGLLDTAVSLADRCIQLLEPNSCQRTHVHLTLSYGLDRQGRVAESYFQLKQAQRTAIDHEMRAMMIFAIVEEARRAIRTGLFDYGAILYGAFLRMSALTGYNASSPNPQIDRPRAELVSELGQERFRACTEHGRRLPLETLATANLDNPLSI